MHMSRMSTVLTEERGNNPFSRFRHKTAIDHQDIDHQDIDSQESDLILADVLCQLKTCLKRGKLLVIAKMSQRTKHIFDARKTVQHLASLKILLLGCFDVARLGEQQHGT